MLRRTDELAELLWDHGGPALRRPPPPFQPFTCGAAGSSRAHEVKRHAAGAVAVPLGMQMHDDGPTAPLGLGGGLPVHDDDDVPPWLHCPAVPVVGVDDDDDTAPLPPEYCASLLSDYTAPTPAVQDAAAPKQAATPSAKGVVNFTFFSRPLQRPQQPGSQQSHAVESAAVAQAAATTNRLRSTPLFSDQRMAWLQPPKAPHAAVAGTPAAPAAAAAPPLVAPPDPRHGAGEAAATVTVTQTHHHRVQPEARGPDAAAVTTSSVCSGNGDRGQAKRSCHHRQQQPTDCSVSQDEEQELDDEGGGAARRSASRSSKRSRTAEVHNLSERRRRDRINEKMRALQELIPNCNKIDKASMLEEAIEYLKTLQLQVQMMSMGTAGLCVPPMLVPAAAMAMPPPYPMAAAAHCFPHHHHQLGLGLGFGAAAAAAFDMVPLPRHFPCPPMAMPAPGHLFGVPAGAPQALFAAHASAGCAPPPEQRMDAAARPGAEHPPPAPAAAAQKPQEHPKPTSS